VRIERLGDLGDGPSVLGAVASDAAARPAALFGEWFGSRAVIAPAVVAAPVSRCDVFATGAGAAGDVIGGGWFGYLSYPDAGADGRPPRIPEAAGGWADYVLRQDSDETWWYESLSGAPMPAWLAQTLSTRPNRSSTCRVEWAAADRVAHRAGVLACLDAITAGEVYQACVCTQFTGTADGSPVDFFIEAVARTTPARAAFVAGDWGAVASLSPELFLSRHGDTGAGRPATPDTGAGRPATFDTVTSCPIKGTVPAWAAPSALLESAKDVAENIMIVDLVRNDLGRVGRVGSVTTPELLAVRPAPGVWHLVSTVSARVPVDIPMAAVLDATFPPASVTGTPKTRARQLLSQWEPCRRGIFCGTIGLASPVAGTELNVAIRTVEFDAHGAAVLGVGGGITADSDPDSEWDECLHKAAPLLYALDRSTAS
jgi:para-aminobenzoate synthetase component 1